MNAARAHLRPLELRVVREIAVTPPIPRRRDVAGRFGLPPREPPVVVADPVRLSLRPGAIVLLAGPSGSGKSSVLAAIAHAAGSAVRVGDGRIDRRRAIIDAVAPRRSLATAMEILTACGLGEPRLWLRRYDDLSDGERFRAQLARAIGRAMQAGDGPPILCGEFASVLHRRAARAVAYNLRKLVTRHRLALVVATAHDDIAADLRPDEIIRLGGGIARAVECRSEAGPMSLRRRLRVEPGGVRDYAAFAPMHYRSGDAPGFVDKIFVLREGRRGDALGVVVFGHAPLELSMRNFATENRFVRNPRRLNRELRILRRLVVHPDVRGCGLGHWLVRRTLPRVGVRFIECLAAMGAVVPVFERAGMKRVGRCPLPRGRMALLARLHQLKTDPFSDEFARRIARCPRVRRLVARTVEQYLRAVGAGSSADPFRRTPDALARAFRRIIGDPPVYYLWDRDGEFPRFMAGRDRRDPHDGRPSRRDRSGGRDRHDPRRSSGSRPGGR